MNRFLLLGNMSLRLKHLFRRISRDHGSQNPAGSSSSFGKSTSASSNSGTEAKKKSFVSYTPDSLATVKEEKSTKHKSRKMSEPVQSRTTSSGGSRKEAKLSASNDNLCGVPPRKKASMQEAPHPADAAEVGGESEEKFRLEKMVSDLIKNNECKKQEIAALKMEINRLKVRGTGRLSAVAASSSS